MRIYHDQGSAEIKRNDKLNKGFTLVELIVVMVIMSILLSLSVFGILAWQDWSRFKQQNEYAQSLFIAAQNQLNEYSASGRLEELCGQLLNAEDDSLNYGFLVNENVVKTIVKEEPLTFYDMDSLWPESIGKDNPDLYRDKIVSIRASKHQYKTFLSDPEAMRNSADKKQREAYLLFELVGSYLYDTSILENASICIEFTPHNGQVFSVSFSDNNDLLTYNRIDASIGGSWAQENVLPDQASASLLNRGEIYRQEHMVGYYSVDTLYASTQNKLVSPKITRLMLHNEETLYLTYSLLKDKEMLQLLNYDLVLFESDTKQERLSFTLDGTKLRNKDNAQGIPCTIYRQEAQKDAFGDPVKDAAGKIKYSDSKQELGQFPIFAYIDETKTVNIIFDAADIQAQTYTYRGELDKIYGSNAYADTDFAKTYSIFRFGMEPMDLFVSVKARMDGYKDSPVKKSNVKHSAFEEGSQQIAENKLQQSFKIKNARHLYNVRYLEDLSYAEQSGKTMADKTYPLESVSFTLAADIDFTKFQAEGYLFDSYVNNPGTGIALSRVNGRIVDKSDAQKTLSAVDRYNCDFPSFARLRERDSFDGKNKAVRGLSVSELSNALYGIYLNDLNDPTSISNEKPVGLFNVNYGDLKDTTLDDITVCGTNYVGSFTGINAGQVTGLKTDDTQNRSRISGYKNVGGIVGFMLPVTEGIKVSGLENRAAVSGVLAVGGIMGMVRNEFASISLDGISELTSMISSGRIKTNNITVLVNNCKNYGFVSGSNKDELKGIFTTEKLGAPSAAGVDFTRLGSFEMDDPKAIEARYIGGIVGYCYNQFADADKIDSITIRDCLSSPQIDSQKLKAILKDENSVMAYLKGVYVGGISGMNHFCRIDSCLTSAEKNKEGYLFGYRYVGGIVGFNLGPASGIRGAEKGKQGKNENNVIGYEYAGGITGCNASVQDKDSLGNDIKAEGGRDPEKLKGILVPDSSRNLSVKIENWLNEGLVFAVNAYSGGITGYNAGWIYGCNCKITPDKGNQYFDQNFYGDYSGGIAGYNNGVIGNTERVVDANNFDSSYTQAGEKISIASYVKGHNYIGGIVGYNDVDAIVENYEVVSGSVFGNEGSCFVGGYVGLNASIDLLMDENSDTARVIYSNPNNVKGDYFVGGNIGGNIINTNNYKKTPETPPVTPPPMTPPDGPTDPVEATTKTDSDKVYATIEFNNKWGSNNDWNISTKIILHNDTDDQIDSWYFTMDDPAFDFDQITVYDSGGYKYEPGTKRFMAFSAACSFFAPHSTRNTQVLLHFNSEEAYNAALNNIKPNNHFPVNYLERPENIVHSAYWGMAAHPEDITFTHEKTSETNWGDNRWLVYYNFRIKNNSASFMPGWRIDYTIPEGVKYKAIDCYNSNGTGTNGYVTISGRTVMISGGKDTSAYGIAPHATMYNDINTVIFEFETQEDRQAFVNLKHNFILTFNNVVYAGNVDESAIGSSGASTPGGGGSSGGSGSSGGTTTPTVPTAPDEEHNILAHFRSDNFLGVLEGKEFVGGFIGYNLLMDEDVDKSAWITADALAKEGPEYILQKKIVDAFKAVDVSAFDANTKLIKCKEILDDPDLAFDLTLNPSNDRIFMSGASEDSKTVSNFGSIAGELYVGGVLGYNDNHTKLYMRNVENATPVTARAAIAYPKEQILSEENGLPIYRTTDYKENEIEFRYSYAGGMLGKVTPLVTIDHCNNAPTGDVQTLGTYTGGLCEINEGLVINCSVSSFGDSVTEYIGGLCGLNKSLITKCEYKTRTVSGRNVVGGITAENFGTISQISFVGPKMIVNGQPESRDGVCGLFAGVNGSLGKIEIEKDILNVNIISDGSYVGAACGYNQGLILAKNDDAYHTDDATKGKTDKNIHITGQIRGYTMVGGVVGCNDNENAGKPFAYFSNDASVAATGGNAGGIIGYNKSGNTIEYCENYAVVSATEKGNAGGITAINNSLIRYCTDYETVSAPNGESGGITSLNDSSGVIEFCKVNPVSGKANITFISAKSVGAVAAGNAGMIRNNLLTDVTVTNYKKELGTKLGVVVGVNQASGKIEMPEGSGILRCKAVVETNKSMAGGIAGANAGEIYGTLSKSGELMSVINCDISLKSATYASLGGIVGQNTGYVHDLSVDSRLVGNLGSSETGYGGIAGFSGYPEPMNHAMSLNIESHTVIENCSFDGTLHALGSSGQPAQIGGITGVNGYESTIQNCYIGAREKDEKGNDSPKTEIYAGKYDGKPTFNETDHSSYASVAGIAGENYGSILACDNEARSTDEVRIWGYSGETAGVTGYNYGIVSGIKDEKTGNIQYLSTGRKWSVEQRLTENDKGPGGIVGIYKSTNDLCYIKNFASVTSDYPTNNKCGGIMASLEQFEQPSITFKDVSNYGSIRGYKKVGGFIGQLRSKAAVFRNCLNQGEVYAQTESAGGFLGVHINFTTGCSFISCVNHGKISSSQTGGYGVGGLIGKHEGSMAGTETYLYDCVNTGILMRDKTMSTSGIGQFIGRGEGRITLENCRNYNTYKSTDNGAQSFVSVQGSTAATVRLKNCFDDSGNANLTKYTGNTKPFKGIGDGYSCYYLDNEAGQQDDEFIYEDFGVYANIRSLGKSYASGKYVSFPEWRVCDISSKDITDTSVFLSAPNETNYFAMSPGNFSPQTVRLDFEYDDNSKGIDGVVFYMSNNVYDKNATDTACTYKIKATYYYADNTSANVPEQTVIGKRSILDGKVKIKNPKSDSDNKPTHVILTFTGTRIFYQGAGYIPHERNDKVAAYTKFIADRKEESFSVAKVEVPNKDHTGMNQIMFKMRGKKNSGALAAYNFSDTEDGLIRNSDIFFTNCKLWHSFYAEPVNKDDAVDIYINGKYSEQSKGMEAFQFVLSVDNSGLPAASNYYDCNNFHYEYTVTFTDINGKSSSVSVGEDDAVAHYVTTQQEWDDGNGLQTIPVPVGLDKRIRQIKLHIKYVKRSYLDKSGNTVYVTAAQDSSDADKKCVHFKSFAYIPAGGETSQMMYPGSYAPDAALDMPYNAFSNKNRWIRLLTKNTGEKISVYPALGGYGFDMDDKADDPISEYYYADHRSYEQSAADTDSWGSRIEVYRDIDPKICDLFHGFYESKAKLPSVTNLTTEVSNGSYHVSWTGVNKADGYDYYYVIKDTKGNVIETSDIISVGNDRLYTEIPITAEWRAKNHSFQIFVRARDGYHLKHSDPAKPNYDEDYEKYDSEWNGSDEEAVVKKVLPLPKVHIEVTPDNRSAFVLDNYDEYVEAGCTDCTVKINFDKKEYLLDVSNGKYREPEYIALSTPHTLTIYYQAFPNASIENLFAPSSENRNITEAHLNSVLPTKDQYFNTYFMGFGGETPDQMYYTIQFELPDYDVYHITDISAYDAKIGATVAYSHEISHTANSATTQSIKMNSVLKNLPEEWFTKEWLSDESVNHQIMVRGYVHHTQFDGIFYGHDVALDEPLLLDGTTEENVAKLKSIYDKVYFEKGASVPGVKCVYDSEKNDLADGYVLLLQPDGSYQIYYNATLEMAMANAREQAVSDPSLPRRIYHKYDVVYKYYASPFDETKDTNTKLKVNNYDFQLGYWSRTRSNYQNRTIDSNKNNSSTDSIWQGVQTAPIIDSFEQGEEDGQRTYTVKWDKYFIDQTAFNTTGNQYTVKNTNRTIHADAGKLFKTYQTYLDRVPYSGLGNNTYETIKDEVRLRLNRSYYASYSRAEYQLILYGTTLDGEEVELETVNVSEAKADGTVDGKLEFDNKTATAYDVFHYEHQFKDTENTWNKYPKMAVKVVRKASLTSYPDNTANKDGADFMLPNSTKREIKVKLKLNTISKPSVILENENGVFATSSLSYEVKWGAITDEAQREDLGGYLITVKLAEDENGVISTATKPHYFYVEDLHALAVDPTKYEDGVWGKVDPAKYKKNGDFCTAVIDLSDFNKDDMVNISVKALAKVDAAVYMDGDDGVENTITIPDRLIVPDVTKLLIHAGETAGGMRLYDDASCTYPATYVDPATGVKDEDITLANTVTLGEYAKGISLSYDASSSQYADQPSAKLEIAAAVYDKKDAFDESDVSTHESGDYDGQGALTGKWNDGAYKTLYTKAEPFDLGEASVGDIRNIDLLLPQYESYPGEFAGKWIKIAARAYSSTRIDSQWSDQDKEADATPNYLWIRLPKVMLDDAALYASDCEDSAIELEPFASYGVRGEVVDALEQNGADYTDLTQQLLLIEPDANADGYQFTVTGKDRTDDENNVYTPIYRLYLQRSYDADENADGMWDVYLAALNEETSIKEAEDYAYDVLKVSENSAIPLSDGTTKELAECRYAQTEEEPVYVGTLGSGLNDIYLKDIYALLGEDEDQLKASMQLRFVSDEQTDACSIQLILPEVLSINEAPVSLTTDSYIGIQSILCRSFLTDEKKAVCHEGRSVCYQNQYDAASKAYKKKLIKMDDKDADAYAEGLLGP